MYPERLFDHIEGAGIIPAGNYRDPDIFYLLGTVEFIQSVGYSI